jgi:chromosome segregation protein
LNPASSRQPLEVLERQLAELKDARQRLGAVNLAAEQEVDEVAERRDTLALERDDVAEAITKLRGTISTLNREGRVKLLGGFRPGERAVPGAVHNAVWRRRSRTDLDRCR